MSQHPSEQKQQQQLPREDLPVRASVLPSTQQQQQQQQLPQFREQIHGQAPQPARPQPLGGVGLRANFDDTVQHPYHRATANLNRSKSLTRPERQRPRTGMIKHTTSIRQQAATTTANTAAGGSGGNGGNINSPRTPFNNSNYNGRNQPMSNNLQLQLQQQKQQQLMNNGAQSVMEEQEPLEKEPSVLNNWWAWIAFLCTCCIPNYIIRVWGRKPNKNMQQAWREKVNMLYNS